MIQVMTLRMWWAATAVLLTACSTSSAQSPKQPSPDQVVATVGSTSLTLAQVDERALQQSTSKFGDMKLAQALYEARRNAIDDLVATALLDQEAKALSTDRSSLIEKEITSKVQSVTDADVTSWYQANQSRVQGATLDQVRQPIRAFLTQQRMEVVREQYLDTLRQKTAVHISLEPPRQTIAAGNSPARGPANAPVEIVEFSDFQCPFCLRAHPTVDQVLKTYGDRVRFVYRNYPLPIHPNARPAAEAAACAAEQGKFWPYHDRLFSTPGHLTDTELKQDAVDLGLDAPRFNSCVDSHKYKALVDADQHDGEEAGVNGTPAFFINGRLVNGAQPYEVFKKVIDEELQLKKAR